MEAPAIDGVRQAYPTEASRPNLDLTFYAGTPSNPWTLAVVCAEAAIADALRVYLYAGRSFMTREQALAIYADTGLEGLEGAVVFHENKADLSWAREVIGDKIQRSFSKRLRADDPPLPARLLAHASAVQRPDRTVTRRLGSTIGAPQ